MRILAVALALLGSTPGTPAAAMRCGIYIIAERTPDGHLLFPPGSKDRCRSVPDVRRRS